MEDLTIVEETTQDGTIEDSSTSTTEGSGTKPAEGVTPESSPAPEPAAEGEDSAPSKGAQDRIRQLVAQKHEAEREAAYYKGIAEGKKPEVPPVQSTPNLTVKPNPEDFENGAYDPAYIEALTDYKIEQRQQADHAKTKADTDAQKTAEKEANWSKQVSEVAKARHDFNEVVLNNPGLAINKVMADALKESDKGAEVAYWLGKNPGEAARIAGLTPFTAVREIGRIEERLTSSKAVPVEPKRITNAAEPITPLSGKSDGAKDPSKMTDAEWYEYDKAQKAEKYAKK